MDDLPVNLLDWPKAGTIMDMLARHKISWVNYRPDATSQSSAALWNTGVAGPGTI